MTLATHRNKDSEQPQHASLLRPWRPERPDEARRKRGFPRVKGIGVVYRCKTWLGLKKRERQRVGVRRERFGLGARIMGSSRIIWEPHGIIITLLCLLLSGPFGMRKCDTTATNYFGRHERFMTTRRDVKDEGIITRNFGDLLSART